MLNPHDHQVFTYDFNEKNFLSPFIRLNLLEKGQHTFSMVVSGNHKKKAAHSTRYTPHNQCSIFCQYIFGSTQQG